MLKKRCMPLLLLLSQFSRVRLCATPWTPAHQTPLSMGFCRQEHWSGLPFPSLMHACMLSRFRRVRLCATLWPAAHQAPLSTGFFRQEYWSGFPFPSPWGGIKVCLAAVCYELFLIWLEEFLIFKAVLCYTLPEDRLKKLLQYTCKTPIPFMAMCS